MELIRKNIHMNRQKGKAVSQITLDDDYNIPEQMPDVGRIVQEKGNVEIGEVKVEDGRVRVKGILRFWILYLGETPEWGLHSIQGRIPFEEKINAEQTKDGDSLQLNWMLEDLTAVLINSRKLSIRTVLTLELTVEELFEESILTAVEDCETIQVKTSQLSTTGLAAQKKDICRIKDEIVLPANKPNIREMLWQDVTLQGTELRLSEGEILVKGELVVFILYESEEELGKAFWFEQILPFNSRIEVGGCQDGMVGNVALNLSNSDLEIKPDYDGEMRLLNLDAALELNIQVYEEQRINRICDLYEPGKDWKLLTTPALYESLLICNSSKCRIGERIKTGSPKQQILQICHSRGEIKVDETIQTQDGILVEGVVAIQILYVTADDNNPFLCLKKAVPFEHLIEVPGMEQGCVCHLQTSLDQLAVNLINSEELEVKAVISLRTLVLKQISMQHIMEIQEQPLNPELIKNLPGFLVYTVQSGDSLWEIAKENHTTIEQIRTLNNLTGENLLPGQKLLLVKQVKQL